MSDEQQDYSPIVIGGYVATWEPVPCVSHFVGRQVVIRRQWIIRRGDFFIGYADGPQDVKTLVRFAQALPNAA